MATPAVGREPTSRLGGGGLQIDEERSSAATVLTVDGELDLRTAPRLRVHLGDVVRRERKDVIVDLRAVTFIDSTGLAALLNALRRLTRAERRLILVCGEGPVIRILRLTRLDGTFNLCDDLAEARALSGT